MKNIVGIDLGTTNSSVSFWRNGGPTIIQDPHGSRLIPSAVRMLADGSYVVGREALRGQVLHPLNTILEVKRLMGRYYNEVIDVARYLPYSVVRGANEFALIRVGEIEYPPQYVSAMILRYLKGIAEQELGEDVTEVVIGVPAYFGERQRAATREAGEIAGFEVKRIVAEPTLAALAYGCDPRRDETIAVVDLGGGTFDVSVLEVGEGVIEVKAISGDNFLGGTDFDRDLYEWLINEIQVETGRELSSKPELKRFLLETAIDAKHTLSEVEEHTISLPCLEDSGGLPFRFEATLTRGKFEELCADSLNRLRQPCDRALRDAGLKVEKIDRVLLVGGATRMPAVRRFAENFFGKAPSHLINPDEAVGLGAGVQAAVLGGMAKDILLLDVVPLTLGLADGNGETVPMIPRNTTIPTKKTEICTTLLENQTSVEIRIVQGEHTRAADNRTLAYLTLSDIKLQKGSEAQIEVTFDIDANGILGVEAHDVYGPGRQRVTITSQAGLSRADIERLRRDSPRRTDD